MTQTTRYAVRTISNGMFHDGRGWFRFVGYNDHKFGHSDTTDTTLDKAKLWRVKGAPTRLANRVNKSFGATLLEVVEIRATYEII